MPNPVLKKQKPKQKTKKDTKKQANEKIKQTESKVGGGCFIKL